MTGLSAKGISARANGSVVNDGTISAQSTPAGQPSIGISLDSFAATQKSVVKNGTIAADIAISDNTASSIPDTDTLTVENTGLIAGALALGNGVDIVFNTGTIDGGAGLDTLDYSASAAGVRVNLGDASRSTSAPVRAGAGTGFGGDAEGDTFQGIERVIGSAFDDFVYGGPDGSIVTTAQKRPPDALSGITTASRDAAVL